MVSEKSPNQSQIVCSRLYEKFWIGLEMMIFSRDPYRIYCSYNNCSCLSPVSPRLSPVSPVFLLSLFCLSPDSLLSLFCLSPVSLPSLSCLSPVSLLSLSCLSPVSLQSLSCLSKVSVKGIATVSHFRLVLWTYQS